MKKQGVLNSRLCHVLATLGHTDQLVICDCGLPIPRSADVVDLALVKNLPRFLDTVKAILNEIHVEKAIIANEMETVNPEAYEELVQLLPDVQIEKVSHEEFKRRTRETPNTSFVRTGEATPYANVILISGVNFD